MVLDKIGSFLVDDERFQVQSSATFSRSVQAICNLRAGCCPFCIAPQIVDPKTLMSALCHNLTLCAFKYCATTSTLQSLSNLSFEVGTAGRGVMIS